MSSAAFTLLRAIFHLSFPDGQKIRKIQTGNPMEDTLTKQFALISEYGTEPITWMDETDKDLDTAPGYQIRFWSETPQEGPDSTHLVILDFDGKPLNKEKSLEKFHFFHDIFKDIGEGIRPGMIPPEKPPTWNPARIYLEPENIETGTNRDAIISQSVKIGSVTQVDPTPTRKGRWTGEWKDGVRFTFPAEITPEEVCRNLAKMLECQHDLGRIQKQHKQDSGKPDSSA